MIDREKRLEILSKVAKGELSLEESAEMLRVLEEGDRVAGGDDAGIGSSQIPDGKNGFGSTKWKNWWTIPFFFFTLLTILAGFLVFNSYQETKLGAAFWFSLLFLLLMLAGMIVSLLSAKAPWLHLHIKKKGEGKSRNIHLSFPLPIGAAYWVTKHVHGVIPPHLQDKDIPGTISSLKESFDRQEPIEIHVDDDDDDEEVHIYIG